MNTISLRQVSKRYGKGSAAVEVIHGLDLEVAAGEFLVILGPSGCGKSTLLRMVAGLEAVSGGEIAIAGRVVNHLEPAQRDIAMVFQNYALYPHMSVFDNMAYGLRIAGRSSREIVERVQRAARILELEAVLPRRPGQLSGGQRQRVAMGRAIVREPRIFLFDEPLSNLDARLRAQTRIEIRRLHAQLGITSLFVTHDQLEAMSLAQRLLVMNSGRVEQIGTPAELYHRPATLFVAGFLGSPPMNLLRGQLRDGAFMVGPLNLPLPRTPAHRGDLALGVRAEDARLASSGWPMLVVAVEMLGAETWIHGSLGGQPFTVRQDRDEHAPLAGATVAVAVDADRLHWFDPAGGRRLSEVATN